MTHVAPPLRPAHRAGFARAGLALLVLLAARCGSSPASPPPAHGALPDQCRTHPPLDAGVVPPRLIHRVDPQPGPAAAFPVYVCLSGRVTAKGDLVDLRVVRSAGTSMDAAALAAARQWRYLPAMRDGAAIEVPIDVVMTLTTRS